MEETASTAPKPFVFVLMPFRQDFGDIYRFGIKGAAEAIGAYAERLDEQVFDEGMLERIFNQISKADVIVADMTGRNENVFYEVGYAHALNKVVLLLTQNSEDIPFDLKHRQHIVYGGEIGKLRTALERVLPWAVEESKRRGRETGTPRLLVDIVGHEVLAAQLGVSNPSIRPPKTLSYLPADARVIPISVTNGSPVTTDPIEHVYILVPDNPRIVLVNTTSALAISERCSPAGFVRVPDAHQEGGFAHQYRISSTSVSIPPKAVQGYSFHVQSKDAVGLVAERFRLRIYCGDRPVDYDFILEIDPTE